ncbi:ribbon-helix-helix protein, CopG family [Jiangella anatolica]|uniref:Antitoxin n=1 Tax=Jiangella anatolica TaxID=2670374 RepID=A0A2W2BZM9_9ACTN|nr:ribbon-helix-helix protein, CopG family [Jiangella anatolica]PZF85308.1 antitoxin [Jiangella anatolica]
MTVQIAVRLPDDVVAYLDERVASGDAPSRAAVVTEALEAARRRAAAERDAKIYAALEDDPDDLQGLAEWAVGKPLGLD